MLDGIAYGVGVALRTSATPLLLGLRWAERRKQSLPRESWKLASKTALDEFFLATEIASAAIISLRDGRRVAGEIHEALALYERRGWNDDPSSFHVAPPPLRTVTRRRLRSPLGSYQHLQFDSGYAPHPDEPGRERWLAHRANHTAHAWLLEHAGAPRPWLVCVPGYRMGHPAVDFVGLHARWLHLTLGLNLAIPVLPLHGPRRAGRRGGDGFFSGDFIDTVHAQAQAVWDTRRLLSWLRRDGDVSTGIYGISLGGYTAGLVAGHEDGLDCVIAGIPAIDFVRLMQSHLPNFLVRAAERIDLPLARITRLLRVVSPLAIPPRAPRERRFLYAGVADRLASPDHARALWRHWDKPRIDWYEGGHVSFLWEPAVRRLLRDALEQSGLTANAAQR